jgi:hypothetical protein
MIRAIYIFAACCLVIGSAGCLTLKDADGKGSRKYIIPALTVVTTRADEKGEARTMTILPLTYVRKSITSPDGVKTESFAIALIATAWKNKTDATGYEDKELFIVPLLFYYHKQTGLSAAAEVAPAAKDHKEDWQMVLVLAGYHGSRDQGVFSSWGYFNLLFGFSRSGDYRVVKIFHLIPIPVSSGKKPVTPSD